MSPGRKPRRSPASTAGRVRMMRLTSRSAIAATASAIARYVLPVPAGPIANVIVHLRIASTYAFWLTVFGVICVPRWGQTTSSKTSRGSCAASIAARTASTVPGPIACPPSTSSTSSSMTTRASPTFVSSPSRVRRFPRSSSATPSRSRSAWRMPSSIVASSAATSFETDRTSCKWTKCRDGRRLPRGRREPPSGFSLAVRGARVVRRSHRNRPELGQLFAHELAHDRPVGPPRHLRHHVCHHAAEVAQRRRPGLGDRVVDDSLELVLVNRLGHELLNDLELALFFRGLLLPAAPAERLRRFGPALALALENVQLLVLLQRALHLLLRRPQRCEREPERVRALLVAGTHRGLELLLDSRD